MSTESRNGVVMRIAFRRSSLDGGAATAVVGATSVLIAVPTTTHVAFSSFIVASSRRKAVDDRPPAASRDCGPKYPHASRAVMSQRLDLVCQRTPPMVKALWRSG